MKRTISAMVGKGSVNHNSRKFHAENTDPSRSHLNICYCNTDIKEFLTIFSGEVEVVAGNESFRINAGDSLRFKADVEHSYRNVGSKTVSIHMIIHYTRK